MPRGKNRNKKIGRSTLRVNKQPVSKTSHHLLKKHDIFVGKPTPVYGMPVKLKMLLEKYANKNTMNEAVLKNTPKKKENKKNILNGFTAFRTYYSKFGKSYIDQENLSKDLAIFWKNDLSIQYIWHGYSEEYKVSDTNLSFVTWFDTVKSGFKTDDSKTNECLTKKTNISHLVVEDIYIPVDMGFNTD